MARMHNPPHPGKILCDALGEIGVTTAARKLHVLPQTLSRWQTSRKRRPRIEGFDAAA